MGGKHRLVDRLIPILNAVRQAPDQPYLEPFLGAAHVLSRMRGPRVASDVHPDLILLWQGIRDGTYSPPVFVSEEEYQSLRSAPPSAHRGFVGVCCSYGGKWFGGYARATRQSSSDQQDATTAEDRYAREGRRTVLALKRSLQGVELRCCSYDEHTPHNQLVYCDSPYSGTTGYQDRPDFDHARYWQTMREWSQDNIVVCSEYQAPADFDPVAVFPTKTSVHVRGRHDPRLERLFVHRDCPSYRRTRAIVQDGLLLLGDPDSLFLPADR